MKQPPNILLITADDMNWDAVGAYGCPVPGTTPNIDRLAAEGMRFDYSHVTIAVCQPSRSALLTGRYPHCSGGEGFHNLRLPDVPILPQLLKDNGYHVGILGKVGHSTPYAEFQWDLQKDFEELGYGRNPQLYARDMEDFLSHKGEPQQPFFLMLNSHDPHRPFYGNDNPEWYEDDEHPAAIPSRCFKAEEIEVPGFLEDLPEVRLEIAEYYSSVRRCDDTIGEVLRVLREAGHEQDTIVIFLSDNGMAFPFAKTNCYLNSTRTPWIMRWPGVIAPGSHNSEDFISGIDLMPTLLEAANIPFPQGMNGASFIPLLEGREQSGRDLLFTQFHQTAGHKDYPMRGVQNRRFGYIFNPWSNGHRVFKNESQSGRTMQAMREAAQTDSRVAERVQLFTYRVPEEFYDFANDPDGRHNLINHPEFQETINNLRNTLEDWMIATNDPALPAFQNRSSDEAVESWMENLPLNHSK
ncbi:sulfatase family protein [Coraliomargarita parva]|uniref:sulfatase family protein n=1 Tax=Coraliomargarita parva TaxID=3014050 RepID=UPI0022B362B9|nr:sulfatase [Coraliomargarita parva]